ncbi:MAG: hypothetical protein CMJ34_08035 [Phycisphaerae bacterium]|nr:hypothetical protein [Phycisphaerae bacterium]
MLRSPRFARTTARLLGGLLVAAVAGTANAKDLKVGDTAPQVKVKEWIQGEIEVGEGKPYIVEFWATWCGPCKRSIPHLNSLYKKYKDSGLTIIGVSDETKAVSKVRSFVKNQGDRMSYPVAIDGGVKREWFEAAGQRGIPSAFIVDNRNKIAFIGHPMDPQFDEILAQVIDGRYNPKLQKKAAPKLAAAERAIKVRNWNDAYRHFDEVIELDAPFFLSVAVEKYRVMSCEQKNTEGAKAWGSSMLGLYSDDKGALRLMAETMADDPDQCLHNFELARSAADRLLELSSPNDPTALATSAMVAYRSGDKDRAVREQMQAWMSVDPDLKDAYRRELDVYRGTTKRTKRR